MRPHIEGNARLQGVPRPNGIFNWRPYFIASVLVSLLLAIILRCCGGYLIALGLFVGIFLETYTGRQWRWEKLKGFALEDYIKLHVLTDNTPQGFHNFLDEVASIQLPRDKAQWMVYLVHGTETGCKVLLRFHHVIADGAGLGMWFYNMCVDEEQQKKDLEARKEMAAKAKANRGGKRSNRGTLDTLDALCAKVLIILGGLLKLLLLQRDSNSPVKGPKVGRKKTAVLGQDLLFQLEEVKKVGKALHPEMTVNDTMCALIGGTFTRYYKSLQLHPEQMMMRVTMPINVRYGSTIKMENSFTIVFKSLPIHLPTPEERIAHFHIRMGMLKSGMEPQLSILLQHVLTWLPEPLMRLVVLRFTICSSAVLTNVLASAAPFYVCGQKSLNTAFWVPASGDIGVGISIMTYTDQVGVNFISDENLIADWAPVVRFLREEWAAMKAIAEREQPIALLPQKAANLLTICKKWGFPWNTR
eukprot:GGOE01012443.1.p1 GENE.GGOE01012443.1~~GGOE01012443.1.p1  ORF type:complete len:526 (-),score=174.15 GGOE01012443.1:509-1924(-)